MNDWELVSWEDVLTIKNGKNQKKVVNPDGAYPIYGSGGVMGYADDYLCDAGATVIGRKGSINNPLYVEEKFWNVDTAFGLCAGDKLDNKFLYYFCITYNFLKHNKATTLPSLTKADLLKIKIPLPPLAEQQKIAAILDAADQLRQKDQQLIEHYTALGQSLFLEMFGDPVSNPKGWAKSSAEDHIDLLTGYAFKSNEYSNEKDDIHLCGGLIITPDGIDWEKANYWSRDKLDGLERYRVVCGDIVMAMDRPWISNGFKIHKITPDDKESLLVQRTARIRGKGIDQTFLYFLYKHPAFERQASTTETTVPHISPKDIRKYEFILPPIELQKKFAQGIEAIEQQKQQAQAALEKSDTLFNSLLQRAFKGELTQSTVT